MATIEGVDYAFGWSPGVGAKLRAAGKSFVCRYLSGNGVKDLSLPEIADLRSAGLDIVVVWETDGRTGPLEGALGGRNDAAGAINEARKLGIPSGVCLYFAVDFGATGAQQAAITAYFVSAAAECRTNGYRCGAYGGLSAVSWLAGIVDCDWQTYAWSGGAWSPADELQQYLNGQSVAGLSVDLDRAVAGDFGQWKALRRSDMVLIKTTPSGVMVLDRGGASAPVTLTPAQGAAFQASGLPVVPLPDTELNPYVDKVAKTLTGAGGVLNVSGELKLGG